MKCNTEYIEYIACAVVSGQGSMLIYFSQSVRVFIVNSMSIARHFPSHWNNKKKTIGKLGRIVFTFVADKQRSKYIVNKYVGLMINCVRYKLNIKQTSTT